MVAKPKKFNPDPSYRKPRSQYTHVSVGIHFLVKPNPLTTLPGNLISCHPYALPMGFLDGWVRRISETVSLPVFWGQVTLASGEGAGR